MELFFSFWFCSGSLPSRSNGSTNKAVVLAVKDSGNRLPAEVGRVCRVGVDILTGDDEWGLSLSLFLLLLLLLLLVVKDGIMDRRTGDDDKGKESTPDGSPGCSSVECISCFFHSPSGSSTSGGCTNKAAVLSLSDAGNRRNDDDKPRRLPVGVVGEARVDWFLVLLRNDGIRDRFRGADGVDRDDDEFRGGVIMVEDDDDDIMWMEH